MASLCPNTGTAGPWCPLLGVLHSDLLPPAEPAVGPFQPGECGQALWGDVLSVSPPHRAMSCLMPVALVWPGPSSNSCRVSDGFPPAAHSAQWHNTPSTAQVCLTHHIVTPTTTPQNNPQTPYNFHLLCNPPTTTHHPSCATAILHHNHKTL